MVAGQFFLKKTGPHRTDKKNKEKKTDQTKRNWKTTYEEKSKNG